MKLFTCLVATMMIALNVSAQKKIQVKESNESIGGGNNNVLTVLVYELSPNDVEKEWKSVLKNYKGKVGTTKGEIFGDDLYIKDFGDNTVDVYSKVSDNKDGSVTLIVGFNLGGAYLSSSQHPEQFKVARDMIQKFAVDATKNGIGNQLNEAEKVQKKLEKEQDNLVSEKSSLEKDIENYKNKIKEAESAIEENKKNQETKKSEIEAQKKAVQAIETKLKAVN